MAVRGRCTVRLTFVAAALAVLFVPSDFFATPVSARQNAAPSVVAAPVADLSDAQKEEFLKQAKIVRTRGASKGVTATLRATLSDGTVTHDASIQAIDERRAEFRSNRGTELNFRDYWGYNVAAYRIDRLLELDMIPPSVERSFQGKTAAFTWWVDDVLMEEGERIKQKATAPDANLWNEQMWHVRLFDQLIYNVDRNLGNLLIEKNWTIWMIDHSRAFRLFEKIKTPANVSKCDRKVFEKLKALDAPTLKAAVEDYLTGSEQRAMLARRDEIVTMLEKVGPNALFDRCAKIVEKPIADARGWIVNCRVPGGTY